MFRSILLLVVIASISGCNNEKESSPFDEILSKPPYASLTDSIKEEPANHELYFRRAILLNKNELAAPALADFRKAWDLNKQEKYAFGVSTILLDKNPDSAIAFIADARTHFPQSILLGLSQARTLERQGKPEQALVVCDELLKINPEQVDVIKLKASLLAATGKQSSAVPLLEKAYSLTPSDIELNYFLALQYAESKNSKVLALADSLIKKDSLGIHAEPYYYKGIYYSNISEPTKALAAFNDAIQHDYTFLDAHIEKGSLLYEQKKYEDALKAFNIALSISPKFADSYYWIAKTQEAMGQKQEAKLNYERAYGLDKTLTQAKEGAERLK